MTTRWTVINYKCVKVQITPTVTYEGIEIAIFGSTSFFKIVFDKQVDGPSSHHRIFTPATLD